MLFIPGQNEAGSESIGQDLKQLPPVEAHLIALAKILGSSIQKLFLVYIPCPSVPPGVKMG
jgi:hypothetical protein